MFLTLLRITRKTNNYPWTKHHGEKPRTQREAEAPAAPQNAREACRQLHAHATQRGLPSLQLLQEEREPRGDIQPASHQHVTLWESLLWFRLLGTAEDSDCDRGREEGREGGASSSPRPGRQSSPLRTHTDSQPGALLICKPSWWHSLTKEDGGVQVSLPRALR